MMEALGKCSTLEKHLLIQKKTQAAVAVVDYESDCIRGSEDDSCAKCLMLAVKNEFWLRTNLIKSERTILVCNELITTIFNGTSQ